MGNKSSSLISVMLCFPLTYILSYLTVHAYKFDYISQVNLSIFSLIVSLLATVSVAIILTASNNMQYYFEIILGRKIRLLLGILGLFSVSTFAIVSSIMYRDAGRIAFQNWNEIPPVLMLASIVMYANLLYVLPYILNRTVLARFKPTFLEKLVFYPALSGLVYGFLDIMDIHLEAGIFNSPVILIFLNGLSMALFLRDYKSKKAINYSKIHIDWLEIFGITLAIIFNVFIVYSAIQNNLFLRGDMYGDAHRVALLNKYGIIGYYEFEDYPPFYSLFWSSLTKLLPIPYINVLILIAFFNHAFSVITFYLLAKTLFKSKKSGLLSVIFWTSFAGFSFFYLLTNPPEAPIFGGALLNYINGISSRFGVYSGSIISPIYADGHTLTRLWSLSLYFIALIALLRGCLNDNPRSYLLLFSTSLFQILLGHFSEAPLVALAVFAVILLEPPKPNIRREIFLSCFLPALAHFFLIYMLNAYNSTFTLISFTPSLAALFAFGLVRFLRRLKDIFHGRVSGYMKYIMINGYIYVYGLMLIAFIIKYPNVWINWPITTVWYAPAVEWGFLGLLSVLASARLRLCKEKWQFGLKFIIFLLSLQLFLLTFLNYLNYNFFYIITPYPLQPILFLPILALMASQIFPTIRFKKSSSHKIRSSLITLLIILVFSFGPLDHVLSASYWKTNDGWWLNTPLNPSSEDYELINFLYGRTPASPYEFVGTFYNWYDPSSYVVYPSGMAVLSQPLIDILSRANDSKEIYLLTSVLPINYVLVSKERPLPPSYLAYAINALKPILENDKYSLYSINQFNFSKTNLLPSSNKFLTVTRIFFSGNLTLMDKLNGKIYIRDTSGEILPINEGRVIIYANSSGKNIHNKIVTSTPSIDVKGDITLIDMKSTWGYFDEINCIAQELTISGDTLFKIFNTFEDRIYIESFTYNGKYRAFPFPTYLRPDYAKKMIEDYLKANYISPLSTITTPIGIVWTIVAILLLLRQAPVGVRVTLRWHARECYKSLERVRIYDKNPLS